MKTKMTRSFTPRLFGAALLGLLALAGCQSKPVGTKSMRTCEATVTRGDGNFKATVSQTPKETEEAQRSRTQRAACRSLCAASKDTKLNACTARCMVDIDAGKAGGLVTCTTATVTK